MAKEHTIDLNQHLTDSLKKNIINFIVLNLVLCWDFAIDCIILQGATSILFTSCTFLSVVVDSDIRKRKLIQTSFQSKTSGQNSALKEHQPNTFYKPDSYESPRKVPVLANFHCENGCEHLALWDTTAFLWMSWVIDYLKETKPKISYHLNWHKACL